MMELEGIIGKEPFRQRAPQREAQKAPVQSAPAAPGPKTVDYAEFLQQMLSMVPAYDKELKFTINRTLNEVVVKVIDSKTDKVIKEIPPEDIQRLQARIREEVGLLFDKKA